MQTAIVFAVMSGVLIGCLLIQKNYYRRYIGILNDKIASLEKNR